jgi:hypothetical protein
MRRRLFSSLSKSVPTFGEHISGCEGSMFVAFDVPFFNSLQRRKEAL